MKGDLFSVGSGSPFAYGVVDSGFDYDLSVQEAIELGRRSIYHAAHRDSASGGSINGMLYLNAINLCLSISYTDFFFFT